MSTLMGMNIAEGVHFEVFHNVTFRVFVQMLVYGYSERSFEDD
jgi:hypothetical protein